MTLTQKIINLEESITNQVIYCKYDCGKTRKFTNNKDCVVGGYANDHFNKNKKHEINNNLIKCLNKIEGT